MADFCGLTRVKTWRWSRLFACAVAVFCAISPISSFADGYVCQDAYVICSPGFQVSNKTNYAEGDLCEVCPRGQYKISIDTGTDRNSWVSGNSRCVNMPDGAIDDNSCGVFARSGTGPTVCYGRPIILCGENKYRKWNSDNSGFECGNCDSIFAKPADTWGGVSASIAPNDYTGTDRIRMSSDGKVYVPDALLNEKQCYALGSKCAAGYYKYESSTRIHCYKIDGDTMVNTPLATDLTSANIRCKAGYFMTINASNDANAPGKVNCNPCPQTTTKEADANQNTLGQRACNMCASDNYYYSRMAKNDTDDHTECFPCSAVGEGDEQALSGGCGKRDDDYPTSFYRGRDNSIECSEGYYRESDDKSSNGFGGVKCKKCPTGYTTNGYLGPYDVPEQDACTKCAYGYFRSPKDNKCYKCPDSNDSDYTAVKACRGTRGTAGYGGGDEKQYLLCGGGYYRTEIIENDTIVGYKCEPCFMSTKQEDYYPSDLTDASAFVTGGNQCNECPQNYFLPIPNSTANQSTCYKCPDNAKECTGHTLRCKDGYYYEYVARNSTDRTEHQCSPCPEGTTKGADGSNIINFVNNVFQQRGGSAQCSACSDGYFAPSGTPGPNSCVSCPDNNDVCSDGDLRCKANYYYHYDQDNGEYQCVKCPSFTGKIKDTESVLNNTTGIAQCKVCTDGYYGNPVKEDGFNRANCTPCPAFARLDALGVCIHGTTDGPDDNSSFGFQTTLQSCYIPNASGSVVDDDTLFSDQSYTVYPNFSDAEGIFHFINPASVEAGTAKICTAPSSENISPSGRCTLEAGKICVYINDGVDVNNLNANACIKAIMWRTMYSDADNKERFGISDKTAKMVFSHWGIKNPWYCTDDSDKANAFVGCLTGTLDDCKFKGNVCAPNIDDVSPVGVCQVQDGKCQ